MSIKQIACVTAILAISIVSHTSRASDEGGLGDVLRQVVEQNLAAINSEDLAGAMSRIHTKSPEYDSTQEALPVQFAVLDTRTQLVDFRFIGHDDEFAVARVKLKTVEQSAELFSPNVLDMIAVFHQENGVWKYWSDHILGVELGQ